MSAWRDRTIQRFLDYTKREGDCWIYTGPLSRYGYGHFYAGSRIQRAHRFSYELFVGVIPEELELDHLCRNRACVNPAHLEAVTKRENILRGEGFAAVNAKKTHCPRGHPYSEENTYRDKKSRNCRICNRIRSKERHQRRIVEGLPRA